MESSHEFATPKNTRGAHVLLAVALVFAACSKGSGLRSTGGSPSTAAGGTGGVASSGTGGTMASGGTLTTGGNAALGGMLSTGGAAAGAGTSNGGSLASSGGAGGVHASGGSGGVVGTGGGTWATGGSALGGAVASGGTGGTGQPWDAGSSDGGIVASGYCEGDSPKVTYQDQTITPGVTSYQSSLAMDCCSAYGLNLHASPWLGFDVAVELLLSIDVSTPKEYEVGTALTARAAVRKSGDTLTSVGVNARGSLRVFGIDTTTKTLALGTCLEVVDPKSDLAGTRIYVPRVTITSLAEGKRFQLFLLKDATLRAYSAASQPLDDLVLADAPVLDLNRIAYVEKSTFRIGFNPSQKIGDMVRTQLGTPLSLPFVAVADGARIYVGTFFAGLSSIGPTGPNANVEDIAADGFTLRAPPSGADPRYDDRIVKVLSEAGKLVP